MRRVLPVLMLLLSPSLLLLAQPTEKTAGKGDDPRKPPAIELKTVKLQDLLDKHVAGHKGKMVLIDVWGFFCPSCKEEFPNVLRFHQTYASKGLVCMTISLDEAKDKEKALKFLRINNAQFAHYWVEEGFTGVGKKWDFKIVPAVVIYGRDGQLARVFKCVDAADFSYTDVEAYLKKQLD